MAASRCYAASAPARPSLRFAFSPLSSCAPRIAFHFSLCFSRSLNGLVLFQVLFELPPVFPANNQKQRGDLLPPAQTAYTSPNVVQ